VDDGLGNRPILAEDIIRTRRPRDFSEEQIGHLTVPVDFAAWIATVERHYAFLSDPANDDERALVQAQLRERGLMLRMISELNNMPRLAST
jgi:hypothetical protein